MSDFFHALRRAFDAGRAEFHRAMWQMRRRREMARYDDTF